MQRAFPLAAGLALLSLCHCGGTASLRAAEQGKLDGLATLVDGEVTRGELGKGDAIRLARAIAASDLRKAKGDAGVVTARELGGCARALAGAFAERSEKEDAVAATALSIRIEAGLAPASEATRWLDAVPDGPRAAFRPVAVRALILEGDGARRRALFLDPYEDVRVAALAASSVAAMDAAERSTEVEAVLEAARQDPSLRGRVQAIRSAGALGGERVTIALKDLWPAGDDALREVIVSAWATPSTMEAGGLRELAWAVETQRGAPALTAAVALLRRGGEGTSSALGVVERTIASGSAQERMRAIDGAPLTSAPLRKAVLAATSDPDEMVKLGALARLLAASAEQGGATAEERKSLGAKLLALATAETKRVALGARIALARAGFREVRKLVDQDLKSADPQTRRTAALALVALGELPAAARLVADGDPHVRTATACAILDADR